METIDTKALAQRIHELARLHGLTRRTYQIESRDGPATDTVYRLGKHDVLTIVEYADGRTAIVTPYAPRTDDLLHQRRLVRFYEEAFPNLTFDYDTTLNTVVWKSPGDDKFLVHCIHIGNVENLWTTATVPPEPMSSKVLRTIAQKNAEEA